MGSLRVSVRWHYVYYMGEGVGMDNSKVLIIGSGFPGLIGQAMISALHADFVAVVLFDEPAIVGWDEALDRLTPEPAFDVFLYPPERPEMHITTAPTNGPQPHTKKGKQRKYNNRTNRY